MANRYWVGGTDNWNATAGTKWALTSGGSGGQAVPTSSDDVFFDAGSGAVTVTTLTTSLVCNNLNFTGFTGTFTGSSSTTIAVSSSLTFGSTMTNSSVTALNFVSTSTGNTITCNGIHLNSTVSFNGVGGEWTLQDTFVNVRGVNLVKGTLNDGGNNITAVFVSISGSNTRTLTMGSGTWTLTGSGADTLGGPIWDSTTTTNLTFTAGTSTIKLTNTTNNSATFSGGGLTYNNVWFSRGASTSSITIAGSNTFNNFKDDGTAAHTIKFTDGTTQTLTTFTVNGTAGHLISINGTSTGTHSIIKNGGGTIPCHYLNIQHSVVTPSNTWYAGNNSTNNQATTTAGSGWIFTNQPNEYETKNIASYSNPTKNTAAYSYQTKHTTT